MSDCSTVLERCVGDVERFTAENWGCRPLVCRARGSFDDLLSSAAIADLLELSARRPTLRMVRDGATLSPLEYTKTVRLGGAWIPDVADTDRIAKQLALGATLVLQNLEKVHHPIREFAEALHIEISHPVQANAYFSPPNASGLARHSDSHDVIVIQLEGVKSWDIEGIGPVDLSSGDAVYIPRGCAHAASTASRHSLHLTVGISAVTLGDVVRRAITSTDLGLRKPLPLGFAHVENGQLVTDMVADSFAAVARNLSSSHYGDVVRSERDRVQRTLERSRTLRMQLDACAITDDTRLRRVMDLSLRIVGDRVVLEAGKLELRMPRSTMDALQTIASSSIVTVGQLTGLNEASRYVLARRLLREGVLEVVAQCGTRPPPVG